MCAVHTMHTDNVIYSNVIEYGQLVGVFNALYLIYIFCFVCVGGCRPQVRGTSRALTKNIVHIFRNSLALNLQRYVVSFYDQRQTGEFVFVCVRTSNVIETEYHFTELLGILFCSVFCSWFFFCFRKKKTMAKEENRLKLL